MDGGVLLTSFFSTAPSKMLYPKTAAAAFTCVKNVRRHLISNCSCIHMRQKKAPDQQPFQVQLLQHLHMSKMSEGA
jgi:hypothetical protein